MLRTGVAACISSVFLLGGSLACAPRGVTVVEPRIDSDSTDFSDSHSVLPIDPPAGYYGQQADEPLLPDEALWWRSIQDTLGSHCQLDGALTRAARKHAADVLENPTLTRENGIDYLRFALRWYGIADYLISPLVFDAGQDEAGTIRIPNVKADDWTHCGVGLYQKGKRRKAVLIAVTRVVTMSQVPVKPQPDTNVDIRGALVSGDASHLEAFLEQPSGNVQQVKAFVVGNRQFQLTVPLHEAGTYKLELQVTRRSGPETASLIPLYVGTEIDTRPSVFPDSEELVGDPKVALTQLLNRMRKNLGLHPLIRDYRLDAVAQTHCQDMVESASFGHFSQRSGMLSDRLEARNLHPRQIAENIAQSSNIMRVHHNLMQSPSHRIKVLTPEFTHLGLGVITQGGKTVVTQIFARW